MYIAILCISAVAICTGRVEAKLSRRRLCVAVRRCNLHGACGGKASVSMGCMGYGIVAICTGRVEAKNVVPHRVQEILGCNLHGACGGKVFCLSYMLFCTCCNLHGACGGKVRRHLDDITMPFVAICTGRVEAKAQSRPERPSWLPGCNLHGACGGKVYT